MAGGSARARCRVPARGWLGQPARRAPSPPPRTAGSRPARPRRPTAAGPCRTTARATTALPIPPRPAAHATPAATAPGPTRHAPTPELRPGSTPPTSWPDHRTSDAMHPFAGEPALPNSPRLPAHTPVNVASSSRRRLIPMGKMDGLVALVTGASRGIGEEIAKRFAADGAHIFVTARTVDEGDHVFAGSINSTVQAIRDAGGTAEAIAADLGRAEERARIVAATGSVDVLVNNAA